MSPMILGGSQPYVTQLSALCNSETILSPEITQVARILLSMRFANAKHSRSYKEEVRGLVVWFFAGIRDGTYGCHDPHTYQRVSPTE